ncbi:MAG TPA: hypothetical protein VKU02_22125 [Gemmataceae bacterium]|nr:hypothetical protein [Gemmataceae bacterium]
MPSMILDRAGQAVPNLSVVGSRWNDSRFVKHVALLPPLEIMETGEPPTIAYGRRPVTLAPSDDNPYKVIHVRGEQGFCIDHHIRPYVLAWLEGTDSTAAMKALKTVIDEILVRIHLRDLKISWSAHTSRVILRNRTLKDVGTNKPISWSFSCAGFAVWCFEKATGTQLLVDDDALPPVPLEAILEPYELDSLETQHLLQELQKMNLSHPGPWKIVLPGYLIHSLSRPTTQVHNVPYTPAIDDAYYPKET